MRYRFQNGDQVYEVVIERQGVKYQAVVNGTAYDLEVLDAQPGQLSMRFGERPITLHWAVNGSQKWVSLDGCTYRLDKPSPRSAHPAGEADGSEAVRAPMPAQVRLVQVVEGDEVEKGDTLLLLEAMKMEIRVKAPTKGRIMRMLVSQGQTVDKDQVLAEIGG